MTVSQSIHLIFFIQDELHYDELRETIQDIDGRIIANFYPNLDKWLETNPNRNPDIVISDYNPETGAGLTSLEYFQDKFNKVIYILYTELDYLQNAIDMTKKGVEDYVIYNVPSRFSIVLRKAIEKITNQRNLADNQNFLRRIEKKNTALLNAQPDFLIQLTQDGLILDYKPSQESKVLKDLLTKEELQGRYLEEVFPSSVNHSILHLVQLTLEGQINQKLDFSIMHQGVNHKLEARFVKIGRNESLVILREFTSDSEKEEEYYRAISRISRYRHKENLVKELLNHLVDSDKNLLSEEKKKAYLLLSNILASYMIEDLKKYGRVQPVQYDHAAVMFTDFVGFSNISRYMSPTQLLKELTIYFDEFERICETYGIEKVKTIGDSFLCVSGLGNNKRTSAIDILLAAIEMIRFTDKRREELSKNSEEAWGIRIAIHSGPLIAGIVGHQKIAFDIWGHTVNVASRIESVSKGGLITVSRAMYDNSRDFFDFDFLGEQELKGIGQYDLYSLTGLKQGLYAKDSGKLVPNMNFFKLFEALRDGKHIMKRDGKYIISKQIENKKVKSNELVAN
jgi:adenylate cyclase